MVPKANSGCEKRKPLSLAPISIVERTVEDPDFSRDHKVGYAGNRKFATVTINARESAVELLYVRGALDLTQKMAADRLRALWEAAGGKTQSVDLARDRVDGGRGDPVLGRLRAAEEMKRVRGLVGKRGYEALIRVCCEGRALGELTPHKRERLTLADNLRADLDDIGAMWGFQTCRARA